jgi:D-glycero-D-manno-heptose 1,7-bisphosphate phosphatase
VFYCPHTPEDGCNCRKPLPGLFEQIIARYGVDPSAGTVHVAGDTLRDMQAGAAVGCVPHLVLTGKSESLKNRLSTDPSAGRPVDPPADFPPHTHVHADLAALAHHLLSAS